MPETNKTKGTAWEELRKPFPKEVISKMPRGGVMLDYVGHAAITDRLNAAVGPENWSLEPLSFNEDGTPVITTRKEMAVMWAKLTILGATKVCVGTAPVSKFEVEKELIGDALRNGAMRFGVALDLWSKSELESHITPPTDEHPSEPSRQVDDEPITKLSLDLVRQAMRASGVTGPEAVKFTDFIIGKPAPTTENDAQELLKALETKND